jgi:hypothetical protein
MLLCVVAGVGKLPSSSHNMPGGETNAVCLVIALSSFSLSLSLCLSLSLSLCACACVSNFPTDYTSHGIRWGELARHKDN